LGLGLATFNGTIVTNSDVSNGNTPPGPANAYFGTGNPDAPATRGASKELKRHNGKPQRTP